MQMYSIKRKFRDHTVTDVTNFHQIGDHGQQSYTTYRQRVSNLHCGSLCTTLPVRKQVSIAVFGRYLEHLESVIAWF